MTALRKVILLVCLAFLSSGFMATKGCKETNVNVTPALGPETTKLIDDQKKQINEQQQQITDLKKKDDDRKEQLDQIAGSAYGIDVGTAHIKEDSKGKEIVVAENGLIKKVTGEPSEKRKAEADARTIATLQGDLVKQKELYGQANNEIEGLKNDLKQKDQVIAARDQTIADKTQALKDQEVKHQAEVAANAKAAQEAYNKLKKDKDDLKTYYESKERSIWINILRIGGFAVILLGIATLAISEGRAFWPGLILIGGGALTIFIGIAINIVVSQVWFPIAAFIVGLLILVGLCWAGYHFFTTHKTDNKLTLLLNDMKTEAETLAATGDKEAQQILNQLNAHATYRLGSMSKLEALFTKTGLDEKQKPQ